MNAIREELYIINQTLSNMKYWGYLTEEEKTIEEELKKRKKILEFLLENA